MAYTKQEEAAEFWMLTKGILQDSKIDTDEAKVVKRWLEEHGNDRNFCLALTKIDRFLSDGYISDEESRALMDTFGMILRQLRES